MPTRFRQYLIYSSVVHVLAFLLLFLTPAFRSQQTHNYKVTWIQLSKGDGGTSLKAGLPNSKTLPSSTIREQKYAKQNAVPDKKGSDLVSNQSKTPNTVDQTLSQKRAATNGGVNISNSGQAKNNTQVNDALARINQQLQQREVKIAAAQSTDAVGQSQWGGAQGTAVDPAFIQYYNALTRKISNAWTMSGNTFAGSLRTKIVVMVDEVGNILRSSYESTSGNGSFDEAAMRAVRKSAPFPPPPDSVKKEVLTEGFIFDFDPTSVTGPL